MKIILINCKENPEDIGPSFYSGQSDCDCDCDCACPSEGISIPVLPLPIAYYLELTPVCNNLCLGCGNVYSLNRKSSRNFLDGKCWIDLIRQLASHAHHFKLTGGEATLHRDFSRIVEEIDNTGITFTLFTNARWVKPKKLVYWLKNIHTLDGMLISLHGPNATLHEAFSGVIGSFRETTQNILMASENGIRLATSFVINSRNWNCIEETLDLALSLGASSMVCNRLIGSPVPGLTPAEHEIRHAIETVESLRKNGYPIRFGNCIPQCFERSSSTGCSAGITFATIDPWGMVRPCNHTPSIAGDSVSQTMEQIWSGSVMNDWRSLISGKCRSCSAFSTCHGGCRAQALLEGQAKDPMIRECLAETQPIFSKELFLDSRLHPKGQFVKHSEQNGDILIHKSQTVMIPFANRDMLHTLNGDWSLGEIKQKYGDDMLDTIGLLYEKGMITWADFQPTK